jgi:hypothetical protein
LYGNAKLLGAQLVAVGATAGLAALGTAAIMLTLRWLTGLRPARLEEVWGIDVIEHGEGAYALGIGSLRFHRPLVGISPACEQDHTTRRESIPVAIVDGGSNG